MYGHLAVSKIFANLCMMSVQIGVQGYKMNDITSLIEQHKLARDQYKSSYMKAIRDFGEEITPFVLIYDEIIEKAEETFRKAYALAKTQTRKTELRNLLENIKNIAFDQLLDLSQPAQMKMDERIKLAQRKLREIEEAMELGEEIELQ